MTTLYVAVGGTIGVLARYGVGRLAPSEEQLLWSTAAINIVGSFLLGLLAGTAWFDRELRDGIGVGFLGGFTTFSTFSLQAFTELEAGRPARAAIYVVVSVVGGSVAAAAGYVLGRSAA
jgi:fluoride exporter